MKSPFLSAAVLCVLAAVPLAGCGASEGSDSLSRPVLPIGTGAPAAAGDDVLLGLPATFAGVLPCLDCPGIDYQLNLLPDRTYFLRMAYKGQRQATRDDMGRWAIGSDNETLILTGNRMSPQYFHVQDHVTLRKLDSDARPIDSPMSHDLIRSATFKSLQVQTTIRGSYVATRDAGMFTDCSTRRRWMVANEGGSVELKALYHERQPDLGEALIVSVRGQIAKRPAATGVGSVDVLVVDHVVGATPGATCPPSRDTAPLEGTRWTLTRVGGQDVVPTPGRTAPPVLTLGSASAEFFGSSGCNQTLGSFRRDGDRLKFARNVTTRMECPDHLAADEAFVRALEDVARWRIIGRILELTDAEGSVLARFEAS